ncbi:nicotine blue oxidoreductase [Arthrobacter mobilis]|uniref:Nucleotidyltransferase family protein n=1 Tax=Arthrobacter mobilis TaxID=2724944 RepID=A0A7X6HDP4_9MICC|nr:nucleotidyltransferase family protein [Arthrobacter mobilis]NKX54273.1 nucleotidyltransferase family protein [Arthrobacter mobilis]
MASTLRTPVSAVLLAAGAGTRLGRGPKALLPAGGIPLVQKMAAVLADGGCTDVCVVLGAEAARVRQAADLSGCTVLENPDWAAGMGGSFRLGVNAAPAGHAVLVALVDQPGVTAPLVRRLIAAHQPGRVTAAGYRAPGGALRRGHPVLFAPGPAAAAARQASGDAGARDFLAAHPGLVDVVDCSDLSDGGDIDTPADLFRLGGYQG